jgi:predicted DNA-binding transcriptional regulator AlpA
MQSNHQEIFTEAELSELLRLSRPTLARHRRHGTGPVFVTLSARRVGYRRSAVEAWLEDRKDRGLAKADQELSSTNVSA